MFERNDNYWRSDGPWVDEIEVVGIGDITARVNALLAGDINVLLELDPKAVDLIERSDKADVISTQSGALINLAMMLDRAPTNNADFRLAMKYAIDREKIVRKRAQGLRQRGQRSSHLVGGFLLLYRHRTAHIRSGEGTPPHQESRA